MARTKDQILADTELSIAIERVAKAYGFIDEGWAIGDVVVCVELTGYAEHNLGHGSYLTLIPEEYLPFHRVLGLLRKATLVAEETE